MIKRTLVASLTLLLGAFFIAPAQASIEATLGMDGVLSVRVSEEWLSNGVLVEEFYDEDVTYSGPSAGLFKWVWLECDGDKFFDEANRPFPVLATNCGIEITAPFREPSGKDAQLLVTVIGTQRYDDSTVMKFVQYDQNVMFRGDFGVEDVEAFTTVHLDTFFDSAVRAVALEHDGQWPPGVSAEIHFRGETARIRDPNPSCPGCVDPIELGMGQCNVQMIAQESGPGGGDWKTQTKAMTEIEEPMGSDDDERLPLTPYGRDWIMIAANEDSTCSFIPSGYRLRTIREFPGDSWVTLAQAPVVNYRDVDTFTGSLNADNPMTFRDDQTCGLANSTVRVYIPSGSLRDIPAALTSIRVWLAAGQSEGLDLSGVYVGNANEGALPAYDGTPAGPFSISDPAAFDGAEVSDALTLTRDSGGIIVGFNVANTAGSDCAGNNQETDIDVIDNYVTYTKAASQEAGTTGALAGYSNTTTRSLGFRRLEVLF